MGNELSTAYEGPPEILEGRDIPSIAKYMKSQGCKKVFVMVRSCDGKGVAVVLIRRGGVTARSW